MSSNRLKYRRFLIDGAREMRVLNVKCPECGAKAVIRKTNPKHPHISDIYCACSDVECGHTFVLNLTFSHTLSPSAKTSNMMLQTIINSLSPEQKQMTLDLLEASLAA
ncbi:ogr/Delta-like zinc finger family protein [Citrobacter koseri]|uniref:ogr/Delta-like zinc finger family protein n=2 Tax=Citrobacter TaxID=544 RepID=UPI00359CB3E7